MEKSNEFFISGTVMGILSGARSTQLRIATCGGNSSRTFFPQVQINTRRVPEYVKIGTHVDLWGTIRQIPTGPPENRKWAQLMEVTKIERSKRMLTLYIDGLDDEYQGGHSLDENRFCVCGTIRHVYSPHDGVVILTINTGENQNCNVICYRQYAARARRAKAGDEVIACGNVQNIVSRTENGQPRQQNRRGVYLQESVVWDIEVFPQEDAGD